jgi:hypothetical protein
VFSISLRPQLTIERDGIGGFFIRFTRVPEVTYRLQRAGSVTGLGPTSPRTPRLLPAS